MCSMRRWSPALRLSALHEATAATRTASLAALASGRSARSVFPSFPLTSELLAASGALPRPCVRSPSEVLRSAPAPTASDACPFGSLNRTCRPRNYVNVNAISNTPTEMRRQERMAERYAVGNGTSTSAAQGANGESIHATRLAAQVPRMEMNKLTRRHYTFTEASSSTGSIAAHQTSTPRRQCTSPASTHEGEQQQQQQQRVREEVRASRQDATQASTNTNTNTTTTTTTNNGTSVSGQCQSYKEHCIVGWSLPEFYRVVADVEQYCEFLPWCAASQVHTRTRIGAQETTQAGGEDNKSNAARAAAGKSVSKEQPCDDDVVEMTATLTIGFSFFKEPYTSKVTLRPGRKITAVLHDHPPPQAANTHTSTSSKSSTSSSSSEGAAGLFTSLLRKAAHTATEAARRSILKHLVCEWDFVPVPGRPRQVEVHFTVSFEFSNPLYSKMIMSNVVSIMTSSFERRCERLYGPPSIPRRALPLTS